jgi:hypothetical protein
VLPAPEKRESQFRFFGGGRRSDRIRFAERKTCLQVAFLNACGQKCFCVTFAESNKGRCLRSARKGCDLK